MNGFIKLNGNVIIEAGLDVPVGGWGDPYVPIADIASDPSTLVGKFYNPKTKRVYDLYESRSGKYRDITPLTTEDLHAIDVKNAETTIEIKACNWMVKFIDAAIAYGEPLTADKVPDYVNAQLVKYLGASKYVKGEENAKS